MNKIHNKWYMEVTDETRPYINKYRHSGRAYSTATLSEIYLYVYGIENAEQSISCAGLRTENSLEDFVKIDLQYFRVYILQDLKIDMKSKIKALKI
jgi:hypothetical protein